MLILEMINQNICPLHENVADLAKSGQLKPHVGARFKASEIAQAHDLLESRKSIGKIVVFWNEN